MCRYSEIDSLANPVPGKNRQARRVISGAGRTSGTRLVAARPLTPSQEAVPALPAIPLMWHIRYC